MNETERQLVDLLLDGDLPVSERTGILERLEKDPEAVAYLAARALLQADLRTSLNRRKVQQLALAEAVGRRASNLESKFTPLRRSAFRPVAWARRQSVWIISIAAMLLGLVVVGHLLVPKKPAFDEPRGVKSPRTAVPALRAASGRRAALVVAVSERVSGGGLRGADRDADALVRVLTSQCGFSADRVLVLRGMDATESGVRAALRCLRAQYPGRNDFLYVHFASHGVFENGGLRLLMYDSPAGAGITMADLRAEFSGLDGKALIVADVCHAGGMGTISWGIEQRPWMLAASQTDQKAFESPALGSLFMHVWKSSLEGDADSNADGAVTLAEAFTHTRDGMAKYRPDQQPMLLPDRETDSLVLGGLRPPGTAGYPALPGLVRLSFSEPGQHDLLVDDVLLGRVRLELWNAWFTPGEHRIRLRLRPGDAAEAVLWERVIQVPSGLVEPVTLPVSVSAATLPALGVEGPFDQVSVMPDLSAVQFLPDDSGRGGVITIEVPSGQRAAEYGIRFESLVPVRPASLLAAPRGVVLRARIRSVKTQEGVVIYCGLPHASPYVGASTIVNFHAGEEKVITLNLDKLSVSAALRVGLGLQVPANASAGVYEFHLNNAHFSAP